MTPAAPAQTGLRSALYEGTVLHRRTDGPSRRFAYKVTVPLLFLDEVERTRTLHPLVALDPDRSPRVPRPVRLCRSDFLPGSAGPLADAVRGAAVAAGRPAAGPVALLGHLRTWGWLFNPLTIYYCFDAAGDAVTATVLEVANTPWHERHTYVVGGPGEHRFAKEMHVSPFISMDAHYRLRYSAPEERLRVDLDVVGREGAPVMAATMALARRPLDRSSLGHLVWRTPGPLGVSAGIYRQAVGLAWRGARFHPHPARAMPAHRARHACGRG